MSLLFAPDPNGLGMILARLAFMMRAYKAE